jgi:zinc transport system ATP-binding protein
LTKINSAVCGLCCTRLENADVSFGSIKVLNGINLHIHCGQLAVIIGPNGAGKSTLLKTLLGEIPHTGSIHTCVSEEKGAGYFRIGYVPQRLEFDITSPVNVLDLFAASLAKRPVWSGYSFSLKKTALDSLRSVDAQECLNKRLGTLSGGQLQRVLLALALTPVPDLLLLDEPVSGIDPAGVDLFYKMVSSLRTTNHLSICMVSHDVAIAARYADRLIFLNRSILADGIPSDVLKSDVVVNTFGTISITLNTGNIQEPVTCRFTGGTL